MSSTDSLAVAATAERLRALRDAGVLDDRAFQRGLELTLGSPVPAAWRRFVSRATLALGSVLVLAGIVYFVAYNWHALPKLLKFAVLEASLAGAALVALRVKRHFPRQLALTFAAGLLGPLLATYGQVYQTGADSWILFATWTLLALPFAVAAPSPALGGGGRPGQPLAPPLLVAGAADRC